MRGGSLVTYLFVDALWPIFLTRKYLDRWCQQSECAVRIKK